MNQQRADAIRTLLKACPDGELQVSEELEAILVELLQAPETKAGDECAAGQTEPADTQKLVTRAAWEAPVLSFTYRSGDRAPEICHCRLDLDGGSIESVPVKSERRWTSVLLLVRHAKYEPDPNPEDPGEFLHGGRPSRLSHNGLKETEEVGAVLASIVRDGVENARIQITDVRYAPSWESRATAYALVNCLDSGRSLRPERFSELDPGHTYLFGDEGRLAGLIERISRFSSPSPSALSESDEAYRSYTENTAYATLVVGHLPMLGWLAREITGKAIPMQHSEVFCIELPERLVSRRGRGKLFPARGRLQWVLSPSDPEAMRDLRDKIRSKMDTAKVLGVFIAAGFGFVLKAISDVDATAPLQQIWGYRLTALFFFSSIALYLSSMYSYDSLLMPKRFWADASRKAMRRRPSWVVARPPSPAHWLLYQNMINVWSRQFSLATACVFLGLLSLAFSVLAPQSDWVLPAAAFLASIVLAGWLLFRGAPLWIKRLIGPWLGSDD